MSDDQVECQVRDRLSFIRFLGLGLEDKVPDAKTVWLYREQLTQAGAIEALFEDFDGYLEDQGYLAMGGQIIDASIVAVPKQRNGRDENAKIKDGETPEGWENKPAKRSQKDMDARWTKKHGKSRRNKPLTKREMQGNKTRSKVRARVEHVFGAQSNDMGGTLVRSIGLARATARMGLKNLAYNMRRLVQLERLAMAGFP